jgi:hypothetical protein
MLVLTNIEKTQLLSRFPPIELSYDNILHKKVYAAADVYAADVYAADVYAADVYAADVYALIPAGQKAFIWFTYYRQQSIYAVLLLNEKGNVQEVQVYPVLSQLASGTVLYGTLFNSNGLFHYSIEDIFYYKGQPLAKRSYQEKIVILGKIFWGKELVPKLSDCLVVGLPLLAESYAQAVKKAAELPYSIYAIQLHDFKQIDPKGIYLYRDIILSKPVAAAAAAALPICANFYIKAGLAADLYYLYCSMSKQSSLSKPYSTAMIPSYKSSVFLNSLFRTIKENQNLDLLEESEDETDFENIQEDKFVQLEKTLMMKCVYLRKFRKWQPLELLSNGARINSFNEVRFLEK